MNLLKQTANTLFFFIPNFLSEKVSKKLTSFNEKQLIPGYLYPSLSRIFFFQNKYLINFFSCVYLSSHTVSPSPLIFSSGLV
ncbi:hypothetical protein BpHYR1_000310 [Brachionus plicatilis]|uniref:Uncharacterized protein n=1 Tax=Brachionus plicatilis TaxID=10195 RepID=A0A3M7SHY1_BRAPC|nr:hypothetical protein BpHYR1_000310 [Brachionus plicatilis]